MRRLKLTLAILIILCTLPAIAQEVTIVTPEQPPSNTKYVYGGSEERPADPNQPGSTLRGYVQIWKVNSDGKRVGGFTANLTAAELVQYVHNYMTVAAPGETAGTSATASVRRKNTRALDWLRRNCATLATPCEDAKFYHPTDTTLTP